MTVGLESMDSKSEQTRRKNVTYGHLALGVAIGTVGLGLLGWGVLSSLPQAKERQRRGTPPPLHYRAKVVAVYPHDEAAFTQGLLYHDGALFESTGQYGESTLRRVELETGAVLQKHELEPNYFGEGLALHNGRLIQLTWKEGTAFVYDVETMKLLETLAYAGEGWGLASNGEELFFTDGSDCIRVMDGNLKMRRRIEVRDHTGPVERLNEAEWYKGALLINVWGADLLAQVDSKTGDVLAWIDCSGLLPAGERTSRTDVLNGIAYDAKSDRLFVTGKYWPKLFQIELVKE